MTNKEIVQALRYCSDPDFKDCSGCKCFRYGDCLERLVAAAADLIDRLTAENAKAEAERDALLEQIKARPSCLVCKHFDYCEFDNATVIDCMNCVTKKCPCAGCVNSSRWEWRGLPGAPEEGGKE